jgi:FMN-dependent NADH-azoreductase
MRGLITFKFSKNGNKKSIKDKKKIIIVSQEKFVDK